MSNSLTYRSDIDGLRAAAVLAVIGYHAYPNVVPGGFVGVDIFFVISGFLISSLIFKGLQEGQFRFTEFYARRIRRIFPALTLVLITSLSLGWYLLLTDEYIQLGKHTLGSAAFGPNFVFLKEVDYFDRIAELKPLLHLWSLGIEEQFYILWPFMLVLLWRRKSLLAWVIPLAALGSFGLNIYYLAHAEPNKSFYLPLARCWELLIGAALAHLVFHQNPWLRRLGAVASRDFISVLGIVLIATALVAIDKEALFPGWWALLPTIGACLVIAAGPAARINGILAHPAAVFVGLISYPLYLWHWPLLAFARSAAESDLGSLQKAGILLTSFILSAVTYYVWENPLRKSRAPWNLAALVLLMVVVGISGKMVQKQHGYPGRFPPSIRNIVNAPYAYSSGKSYRLGTCFLDGKKAGFESFSNKCLASAAGAAKKILLWGDSHAAHLYPGLRRFENKGGYRVVQFTASGCPPIMDVEISKRPLCKTINEKILDLIARLRPDVVMMAANWTEDETEWNYTDLKKLELTIAAVKKLNVKRIVLVGPVPAWPAALPKLLITYSKRNDWQKPPDRLALELTKDTLTVDDGISLFAKQNQITYISAYHTFCNSNGCLVKIAGDPTAFDSRHLTDAGSAFLIESNLPKILGSSLPAGIAVQQRH